MGTRGLAAAAGGGAGAAATAACLYPQLPASWPPTEAVRQGFRELGCTLSRWARTEGTLAATSTSRRRPSCSSRTSADTSSSSSSSTVEGNLTSSLRQDTAAVTNSRPRPWLAAGTRQYRRSTWGKRMGKRRTRHQGSWCSSHMRLQATPCQASGPRAAVQAFTTACDRRRISRRSMVGAVARAGEAATILSLHCSGTPGGGRLFILL